MKKTVDGKAFELEIDVEIYSKNIILKSAYNFLDKGFFFFKYLANGNILLQFNLREGINESPEKILGEFADEMLSVYLRDTLEKENKDIREKIVGAAIANSIDTGNFVSINTDETQIEGEIDFDKDIDEILKEIENDPELKIDEQEIQRILKEIEEESKLEDNNPKITLDINGVEDAKKKFQDRG